MTLYIKYDTVMSNRNVDYLIYKKEMFYMHCLEFKRKFNLLTDDEIFFISQLTLKEAINFLKSI